jgi:hypothetical protein
MASLETIRLFNDIINGVIDISNYYENRMNVIDPRNNICKYAAKNGNFELLKYAHENGCPWNEDICTYAAKSGHLDCLQYAHENGCPWNEYTCACAAIYGSY